MLKGKFQGNYKKRVIVNNESKVIDVFRYVVSGNAEELKAYEEAQGDNYRTDDKTGDVLYFSPRYVDDAIELKITENGNVVVDDSMFAKLKSQVEAYGESTVRLMMLMKAQSGQ